MKNLSLQSMQSAPIKNEVVPTENVSAAAVNEDSGAEKSPFQMALSSQIHARQMQAKQSQSKPAQEDNHASGKDALANQLPIKLSVADLLAAKLQGQIKAGNADQVAEVNDSIQVALEAAKEDVNLLPVAQAALSGKDLASRELVAADDKANAKVEIISATATDDKANANEEVISAAATDAAALAATVMAPMMMASFVNVNPQRIATQGASTSPADDRAKKNQPSLELATSVIEPTSEKDGAQAKQKLDLVLSNALAPNKTQSASGIDVKANINVQSSSDVGSVSEHARWLDAVLPGVAKQNTVTDESGVTKLAFNAIKDTIGKAPELKEIGAPANFQAALQVNPAMSTQQAGSANVIASYPGKSGWDQAISQKVIWMVGAGEQSATLTLNPPDLGPLQVVIHVHNDQADTTFISDNAEVRQALENGLSNLRDKMSESGIQLGQTNVSTSGQSQQEFQRATQNRLAKGSNNNNGSITQMSDVSSTESLVRTVNGLVDTFA